jgi:glycosyltransferase involved in cell wall biosynthesis
MTLFGPRLSLGVPVYNGEEYLSAALDSLLAQSYSNFELIISDNASTDRTQAICEAYAERDVRIRYYRQPSNAGAARNFNRTFELASGKYFKWAAHDDLCGRTFLEKCVIALESDPQAVLCMPQTTFIDRQGRPLEEHRYPVDLHTEDRGKRFAAFVGAAHVVVEIFGLIRADVLRRTPLIGPYVGSDVVLLAELGLYGRFLEIREQLFFHREHPGRSTYTHRDLPSRAVWFDSKNAAKRTFPLWRRFGEHLASLQRVPLPLVEKVRLAFAVLRRVNWQRRQLVEELLTRNYPRHSGGSNTQN